MAALSSLAISSTHMGMLPDGLGMMEEFDWFNRRSADSPVCSFVDLAVSAHL